MLERTGNVGLGLFILTLIGSGELLFFNWSLTGQQGVSSETTQKGQNKSNQGGRIIMRKLGILVMALVLVVVMSLGVMAETATNLSEGNAEDQVSVNLNVGGFADVGISGGPLTLNPTEPGIDAYEKVARDHVPVKIHANTSVNVAVQEDLSLAIANEIGRDYVEAFVGNFPKTGDDFLNGTDTVGLGAWLVNEPATAPSETGNKDVWRKDGDRQGVEFSYNFTAGDDGNSDFNGVNLESSNGVVFDGYIHYSMVWYGQDWQELTAEKDYTGNVYVTVSASN